MSLSAAPFLLVKTNVRCSGEKSLRVLFVGQTNAGQTSAMRAAALGRLGLDVYTVDSGGLWNGVRFLQRHWQMKTCSSTRVTDFNHLVLEALQSQQPALLWAEKQEYLSPSVIDECRRRNILSVHYNPDPYFSVAWKRNSLADECLRRYDVVVVTKRYELESYRTHGAREVVYSPLGYDPIEHAPPRTPRHRVPSATEIAFVGGWEPRREQLLAAAMKLTPHVKVWGYGWRQSLQPRSTLLRAVRLGRLAPGRTFYWGAPTLELAAAVQDGESEHGEVYGASYARAIAAAEISLGFLRALCPDQHTTRTFEIPAVGGFMLADRTEEHREFFVEGKEAEFFADETEYLDKIRFYLPRKSLRDRIARAGHQRCLTSGYSYDDRLREVLRRLDIRCASGDLRGWGKAT